MHFRPFARHARWTPLALAPMLMLLASGCPMVTVPDPAGNGNVNDNGNGPGQPVPPAELQITIEGQGTVEQIAVGNLIQLTAIPAADWQFDRWLGTTTARANPLTVLPTDATSINARFVILDEDSDGVPDNEDACPGFDDSLDTDGDGVANGCDNCPINANPTQADGDGDGVADACDNCPAAANTDQADDDDDGLGDACDDCLGDAGNDPDGDGVCAAVDNCDEVPNANQNDADDDGAGDACDTLCPDDPSNDADDDGICGGMDNCPDTANPLQENADGDGSGDACEECDDDPDKTAPGVCGCGIAEGTCCFSAADCNDSDACTEDSCVSKICQHDDISSTCDDDDLCTTDSCDSSTGCVFNTTVLCDSSQFCEPTTGVCEDIPCTIDAECTDGLFCNGLETCDTASGICQEGTAPCIDDLLFCNGLESCDEAGDSCLTTGFPCDDEVFCTDDACTEGAQPNIGTCTNPENDANCDDGLFCNGAETCDAVADCQGGTDPCDDGVECTVDTCGEETDKCLSVPDDTRCGLDTLFCNGPETCDPKTGCPPEDDSPCVGLQTCNETDDVCEGCIFADDCDDDGVDDLEDNCVEVPNPLQKDNDLDGVGNACDNCPNASADPSQIDTDEDGVGDVCDNCINDPNPNQNDRDLDGTGDACPFEAATTWSSTQLLNAMTIDESDPSFKQPERYEIAMGGQLEQASVTLDIAGLISLWGGTITEGVTTVPLGERTQLYTVDDAVFVPGLKGAGFLTITTFDIQLQGSQVTWTFEYEYRLETFPTEDTTNLVQSLIIKGQQTGTLSEDGTLVEWAAPVGTWDRIGILGETHVQLGDVFTPGTWTIQ